MAKRGAERKYDPQPGELFFGQLIVGPSTRLDAPSQRWVIALCPKCLVPRDVNVYRIVQGLSRKCEACAHRASALARVGSVYKTRRHRATGGSCSAGTRLDRDVEDIWAVDANPREGPT